MKVLGLAVIAIISLVGCGGHSDATAQEKAACLAVQSGSRATFQTMILDQRKRVDMRPDELIVAGELKNAVAGLPKSSKVRSSVDALSSAWAHSAVVPEGDPKATERIQQASKAFAAVCKLRATSPRPT